MASIKEEDYEERFIAFVDLLGFKSAIEETGVSTLIKIIQLLRSETEHRPPLVEKKDYMIFMAGSERESEKFHEFREISVFSDLIIVSYPVKNEVSVLNNLHKLLHSIYFVQEHLAENSILIRGGITCGKLYHKGDICIGPALLRAYELEAKVAKFPRVVIDPNLIEQERFAGIVGRWPDYLEKLDDNLWFITHFKHLKNFFDNYTGDHLTTQLRFRKIHITETLYAYKIAIEKALYAGDSRTREKGEWLRKQYIQVVNYFDSFYKYNDQERLYIDIV